MRNPRQGGALSIIIVSCALLASARESVAQSLPSGWQNLDIATSGGSASATSNGTWTVSGGGSNIWGKNDEFQFVHRTVTGDLDISARLSSLQAATNWSKAGVMIRDGLAANARNAFILFSPDLGLAFQQRSTANANTSRVSGGSGAPPVWVRLVRQGNLFTAYRSADGQSWTTVSTATITMPASVSVGLAVSSRDPNDTATATFDSVTISQSPTAPPPPVQGWTSADVGTPALAGTSTVSAGTFTVTGAGADIWGAADQFQYMHQTAQGDVEVIARVASLQGALPLSKIGVMLRDSLASGARNVFIAANGAGGWGFQRRIATDGITYFTAGPSSPIPGWVKLVREGSLFSAYHSTNGSTWTLVGTDTISMSQTIYVGLAVVSRSASALTTATFTNVVVRPLNAASNQPPTATLTGPASGASFTAPATIGLTASASDPDGSISRVEFYRGATLIGTDTTSPYSASWSNAAAGTYALTAVAFDNEGAATTSSAVNVTVNAAGNQPPTVSLTSPTQNATFTAPATIVLSATASDPDGTIARVDFYEGTRLLNSDTTSPYSFTSTGVVAGSYVVTAVARDNSGAATTSAAVNVTVNNSGNQVPNVAISAPANGTAFAAPATITIQATASDADGSIARVEFYRGSTLITTDTTNPYSATWPSAPAGSYSLTARAYDNAGGSRTSTAVNITVSSSTNQWPTVSITSPAAGASFIAPASVSITASASDTDGTIAGVDFYVGTQLIGTDTSSPYSAAWSNVAAGTYSLTAIARDNAGAARTSAAVSVTVNPSTYLPTNLTFNASSDHTSNVTSYVVALRRSADPVTAAPVATRDLGKPTPVSGEITSNISTLVDPLPTGSYYAVVMAIGSGGSSSSTPSATFTK